MKTTHLITLGTWLGCCMIATANEAAANPEHPQRQIPPEMLKKFDKDGDGKLSDEERQAMRETMKGKMEERRKEMIKQYDKDGDGTLSEAEREAMPKPPVPPELMKKFDKDGDGKLSDQEREAAREGMKNFKEKMLEKFDKDGDGQLSEEERAAMPKPPHRPHGPGRGGDAPAPVE